MKRLYLGGCLGWVLCILSINLGFFCLLSNVKASEVKNHNQVCVKKYEPAYDFSSARVFTLAQKTKKTKTKVMMAEPWGKDADLVQKKPEATCQARGGAQWVAEGMIRFHQNVISPADGPRSHYLPSSSEYTRQAICKYGFLKGFILGCDRLMRENDEPWIYPTVCSGKEQGMKLDPVR